MSLILSGCLGLEKGTRAGCTAKLAAAREGCKLQPPAFFPICFPFWEVGKGVYWLVRLLHLWRVEQRQDFRLYADNIPELARRQGLFDAATHTIIERFIPRLPCVAFAVKLQWPAGLAASASVLHVAAGQPPTATFQSGLCLRVAASGRT